MIFEFCWTVGVLFETLVDLLLIQCQVHKRLLFTKLGGFGASSRIVVGRQNEVQRHQVLVGLKEKRKESSMYENEFNHNLEL